MVPGKSGERPGMCQDWGRHEIDGCAVRAPGKGTSGLSQLETHRPHLASSGRGRGQRGLGSPPTYLGHGFLHHLRLIRQGFLLLQGSEKGVQEGQGQGQHPRSSAPA